MPTVRFTEWLPDTPELRKWAAREAQRLGEVLVVAKSSDAGEPDCALVRKLRQDELQRVDMDREEENAFKRMVHDTTLTKWVVRAVYRRG